MDHTRLFTMLLLTLVMGIQAVRTWNAGDRYMAALLAGIPILGWIVIAVDGPAS
jgi:hypothetical protein